MSKLPDKYSDTTEYINPLNPYTGEVSVITLMKNLLNGHDKFPAGMGETVRKPNK